MNSKEKEGCGLDPQAVNCGGWQVERLVGLTLNEFYKMKEVMAALVTMTSVPESVISDS